MASNLLDGRREDILHTTLAQSSDELYVINPPTDTVKAIVEVATDFDGTLPTIRILSNDRTLRDVMEDFIVASNAADLVAEGHLSLRTDERDYAGAVFISSDWVMALVEAGTTEGGIRTDNERFVAQANETYATNFSEADEFTLRTPPISRVKESLTTEMGPEAKMDFSQVLDSLETARGNGDGLDEVTISLLVAAKNDALFYDISRWGENVGVASKATFSRMKNHLEDAGLIGTEKVPVDVGRPRQRLTIRDDRLKRADTPQLASVAESILN